MDCSPFENGLALKPWITWFTGSCSYGVLSQISLFASITSVVGWTLAGLYQIYSCWKEKKSAGFSKWFLISWVVGDVFNCLGCFLSHQMMFQRILALSFLSLDGTLLLQFCYYRWLECQRQRGKVDFLQGYRQSIYDDTTDDDKHSDEEPFVSESTSKSISIANRKSQVTTSTVLVGVATVSSILTPTSGYPLPAPIDSASLLSAYTPTVSSYHNPALGTLFSWICSSLYLFASIPQIFENHRAKSTGGVNMSLFLADLSGNFGYSLSILSAAKAMADATERHAFIVKEAPYLTGIALTIVLELIIVWQYFYYANREPLDHCEIDECSPLLEY